MLERKNERRRTMWALLASLLLHLALILIAAWVFLAEILPPPEPVEEIEITFIEPPPPPPPAAKPVFVDTSSPDAPPPPDAVFESDRDTAAASSLPAEGAEPVPSQEGREQPFLELEEKQLALAKPEPAPPAPESPSVPPSPPQPAEPVEAKVQEEEKKPLRTDPDGLLARAEPLRERPPRPAEIPQPPAPPPTRPSFQRQTRATRLRGSVDNSGRAAVASLATPLGRYRKAISDAIGSNWYHHIGPRMDMFSYGSVTIIFIVDGGGKVRNPRVISNTSNESFEIVTLESILTAEIPPIPPDVLPALEGGQIEIDFSFSIITN
jgi:outer membrane biosynthesis protein TonB